MENLKKMLILDIYQVDDKIMEEQGLIYKNRVKAFHYATGNIMDFAIKQKQADDYYVGKIIHKEVK